VSVATGRPGTAGAAPVEAATAGAAAAGAPTAEASKAGAAPALAVAPPDILGGRILIVDDQEANVMLLERMLRGAGYTSVASTRDPTGVRDLHLAHRYDLIVLDLQMPVLDGFAVMEQLAAVEADGYLPVLVITAEPGHKLRALQAGARDFITKPFERTEVLARVRNMLEVRLLHLGTKRLYEDLLTEQRRSAVLGAVPGAMVGVKEAERLSTPWTRSLRLRHPWLQLNLVTAFAAGGIVFLFQDVIDRMLVLAMFLPVLAGQAGNTGSQTLAVTLRGLFLGEFRPGTGRKLIVKEALLGLLNGALVGLVAATAMFGVATVQGLPRRLTLSAVVFLAMSASCLISSVCGALVPLALRRLGADPAVASSIFVTTATDMASMGMLLGLATLLT
jgi:CheY-like chemotaxis protein